MTSHLRTAKDRSLFSSGSVNGSDHRGDRTAIGTTQPSSPTSPLTALSAALRWAAGVTRWTSRTLLVEATLLYDQRPQALTASKPLTTRCDRSVSNTVLQPFFLSHCRSLRRRQSPLTSGATGMHSSAQLLWQDVGSTGDGTVPPIRSKSPQRNSRG